MKNMNHFFINWILTRFCEQECEYCSVFYKSKFEDFLELHVIKSAIDNIINHCHKNKMIPVFNISGGEPTSHPCINEILEYINVGIIYLHTNLININWIDSVKNNNIVVIATNHDIDPTFNYKIEYIKNKNIKIIVKKLYIKSNLKKIVGYTEYCDAGYNSIFIFPNTDGKHVVKRGSSCVDLSFGDLVNGFTLYNKKMPCITL
jgi:MoaA/NifB/PqqE/SkfB family radical SAM enzyme